MADKEKEKQAKLDRMRHSVAHVMAGSVQKLYPKALFAIGPSIENGFYYDLDMDNKLTAEDLVKIEEGMKEIIKAQIPFEREVLTRAEAKTLFADQPYKLEIIDDLPEDAEISIYRMGDFVDLCRGPHVEHTGKLNPQGFKLLSTAGAYWRGDEKRPMLQRIYGTAFSNPKDLKMHLSYLEEMEKRDHRRLGKELDLFSMHEEAGPGLAYWHPKGSRIRIAIEDFWRKEHYKNGYEMVFTPHVGKSWLWETSGHLDFYKDSMFSSMEMDKSDYYAKPMNCPFHIMIFNTNKHSYRELPCRWAELGTVYRYEKSGSLHGLLRVRGFTQDDAHIICTPDQVEEEISEVLRFSLFMLKSFGFTDIKAYLSTMPGKCVGDQSKWELATESLRKAIVAADLDYEVDEGGGAFYGPKIDLKIKDSIGRQWQLSTIQFDFNLPERFKMVFVDRDGVEKQPYMIHRALLGSIERFFGILTEHYSGAFPVWIAPVQAVIIPVAEAFSDYAKSVNKAFLQKEIRVESDFSQDRMNAKIRNAQNKKIPYMIVVGENEMKEGTVSIRTRKGDRINGKTIEEAADYILGKVATKEEL